MFFTKKSNSLNSMSSHAIHFNPDFLHQDRFLSSAITKQADHLINLYPNISSIFLITDQKNKLTHNKIQKISLARLIRKSQNTTDKLIVILAFNSDELLGEAIEAIRSHKNIFYYGASHLYPASRLVYQDRFALKTLQKIYKKISKWSQYVYLGDSENLIQAISSTKYLQGAYVEIGVFQGKSALVALEYMHQSGISRKSFFIDTFKGFNYKIAKESQDRSFANTHQDTSISAIQKKLAKYTNIKLIKANIISNSIPKRIKKIAVANIDVDIYEATLVALKKVHPLLIIGGIMIVEDYGHTPLVAGGYLAVKHFLNSKYGKKYTPIYLRSGQMFLVKYAN